MVREKIGLIFLLSTYFAIHLTWLSCVSSHTFQTVNLKINKPLHHKHIAYIFGDRGSVYISTLLFELKHLRAENLSCKFKNEIPVFCIMVIDSTVLTIQFHVSVIACVLKIKKSVLIARVSSHLMEAHKPIADSCHFFPKFAYVESKDSQCLLAQ